MYFIEGSNSNRVQKYSSGGRKYFIEGLHFNGNQKNFIWGQKYFSGGYNYIKNTLLRGQISNIKVKF
jgi:hypothetical protein